jgi:hypothetical protein
VTAVARLAACDALLAAGAVAAAVRAFVRARRDRAEGETGLAPALPAIATAALLVFASPIVAALAPGTPTFSVMRYGAEALFLACPLVLAAAAAAP